MRSLGVVLALLSAAWLPLGMVLGLTLCALLFAACVDVETRR